MALSAGELTAIGIGLGNIAAWGKMIYDARKNGKDGTGRPCGMHTAIETRLVAIETEKDGLAREIAGLHEENRQDHRRVFEDIKNLSVAVASAAASAAAAAAAAANRGKKGGGAQ